MGIDDGIETAPRSRGVYCNRTLNLRSIRAIGYDMDYTLIHYKVEDWERRAYAHVRTKLAQAGWPVADLEFIAVIGNDAGWTQIERDQTPILGDDVGTKLTHMDYHVVAEGCGAKGIKVDDPAKVGEALDQALELSRAGHPVLVNAIIGSTDFRKGSISM